MARHGSSVVATHGNKWLQMRSTNYTLYTARHGSSVMATHGNNWLQMLSKTLHAVHMARHGSGVVVVHAHERRVARWHCAITMKVAARLR
eukprot:6168796-Lingulodinium_polyedra.AAC.1